MGVVLLGDRWVSGDAVTSPDSPSAGSQAIHRIGQTVLVGLGALVAFFCLSIFLAGRASASTPGVPAPPALPVALVAMSPQAPLEDAPPPATLAPVAQAVESAVTSGPVGDVLAGVSAALPSPVAAPVDQVVAAVTGASGRAANLVEGVGAAGAGTLGSSPSVVEVRHDGPRPSAGLAEPGGSGIPRARGASARSRGQTADPGSTVPTPAAPAAPAGAPMPKAPAPPVEPSPSTVAVAGTPVLGMCTVAAAPPDDPWSGAVRLADVAPQHRLAWSSIERPG